MRVLKLINSVFVCNPLILCCSSWICMKLYWYWPLRITQACLGGLELFLIAYVPGYRDQSLRSSELINFYSCDPFILWCWSYFFVKLHDIDRRLNWKYQVWLFQYDTHRRLNRKYRILLIWSRIFYVYLRTRTSGPKSA